MPVCVFLSGLSLSGVTGRHCPTPPHLTDLKHLPVLSLVSLVLLSILTCSSRHYICICVFNYLNLPFPDSELLCSRLPHFGGSLLCLWRRAGKIYLPLSYPMTFPHEKGKEDITYHHHLLHAHIRQTGDSLGQWLGDGWRWGTGIVGDWLACLLCTASCPRQPPHNKHCRF